jgi:two-component system response regulator YesN
MTWKKDIDLSSLEWTKDFPKGYYQLMYVSLDHLKNKSNSFQNTDLNSWEASIDIICNEMMDELGLSPSWRWKGEDLSLWLLYMDDPHVNQGQGEVSEKNSIHFADKLRMSIKDFTPFTCSIAISEPIDDLTLLPIVKDELLTYIQFRILYGGNQIFSKERVERWRSVKKTTDNKELEHQINKIIFSLDSKNQENTKTEVANFLGLLQKLPSPEEIEKTIYSLGIQIVNYLLKNTLLKDEYVSMKEVFGLTSKSTNFFELKQEVYEWVKKVLHTLEEMNSTQNADQIDLAKNWIMTNLDQNITIQKIASHVYMNPTYFSEYFKTQTGETVLDFVTRIRIEKARELLLSTDLKIYDISEKVVYSDTKHFSKLFKRQYGETPSKYKEKIILEHR